MRLLSGDLDSKSSFFPMPWNLTFHREFVILKKKIPTIAATCIPIKLFTSPVMKGIQKYTRICILPFGASADGGAAHFEALSQSSPEASRATLAQPQGNLLPEFKGISGPNTKKWLAGCSGVYVHTYTRTHTAPIFFLITVVGVAARSSKTNVWGKKDCEAV